MPWIDPEKRRAYDRARAQIPARKEKDKLRQRGRDARRRAANPETARQRDREKYRRRTNSITSERRFLAYDGEALAAGQKYALLANSREHITNLGGLTTEECLEFLTREYEGNPWRVIFASDYDVTKCLQDVPLDKLAELAHTNRLYWGDYQIRHYPGKIFTVRNTETGAEGKYFDCWGFFQRSFLAVVDEYVAHGMYLSPEDKEVLEWGKGARTGFRKRDITRMVYYNRVECELLEAVMNRLRGAINSAGMRPQQWHGPGVLAEIFLDRARSRKYVEKGFQNVALRRAYFGGRIEVLQRGAIPGPVYDYDIRSAYPTALASFRSAASDYADVAEHMPGMVGLYSVVWNVRGNDGRIVGPEALSSPIVGPFPYRSKDESIHFPPTGRGIYHAVEVDAAIARYGVASAAGLPGVYVERARLAAPGPQPFQTIVEQWYAKRLEHKRAFDLTEVAYKLGLNSAYGKLAQRVGRRRHGDFFLAGYITAWTRAMLMRTIAGREDKIIAFATDGILSREPLPFADANRGEQLGQWERSEYDAVDVLMSGIYRLHKGDDSYGVKSRGWSQLDFDTVIDALDNRKAVGGFEVRNHAFVTYRMAVHSPFTYGPLLGKFVDRYRYLSPETESKRVWTGESWTRAPQTSVARGLEHDGEPLALAEIGASEPINDRAANSEVVWLVTEADAEAALMVDTDGLPLDGAE